MEWKNLLIELLLAGFFAVCCIRAHEPIDPERNATFGGLFRLTGRIERLRRSRWQWFSLVGFMLVLRLQQQLPISSELMVVVMFALFMALPKENGATVRVRTQ